MTRPRTTPDAELLRAVLAEAAVEEAGVSAADARREGDAATTAAATAGAVAAEADELVAYLRGHLSADDEARIERRLVADPAAARALLDLAELEAAAAERADRDPEPVAPPVDLGTAAAWRDLRRRLLRFSFGNAVNPLLLTLAAASLLVSVGLGVRLHRVEERLAAAATASRPVVNLATLDLTAGRRGAAEPAVAVAPGQPLWLGVTPRRRCPVYRAEVEGGGATRPLDGLRRDERGTLNVLLYLPAGRYTLRVFGCQPEERLEEQDFRIETAPSEPAPDGGGSER